MTKIFAVDKNNDWFLDDSNNISIYSGIDAASQHCEQSMKIVVGELVFDVLRGVLGFEQNDTFGNAPDLQLFEARARSILLEVPDVTEVVTFDYEVANNTLTYSAEIKTIYGTDTIGSQLFP